METADRTRTLAAHDMAHLERMIATYGVTAIITSLATICRQCERASAGEPRRLWNAFAIDLEAAAEEIGRIA